VPEVTVRDAHRGDASAIAEVSAAAVPYLVRSAARVAAEIRDDGRLGRRRHVALIDKQVVGAVTVRQAVERRGEREVFLSVKVRPDQGSQGIGTALLGAAAAACRSASRLVALGNGDPISMAFAVRNGFLPTEEHHLAMVRPATLAPVGTEPEGFRAVTLEALPDLRMLLETHNTSATRDPSRRRLTMYQLRDEWWDRPDNAPDLSWGLLAHGPDGPVLAAFTSVEVDRERSRAWTTTTVTHPAYRDQDLAHWVRARTLASLASAGVAQAWTVSEPPDGRQLPGAGLLGYHPAATAVRLVRRLSR
jgi:predicted N-acetyltransferase YhbS